MTQISTEPTRERSLAHYVLLVRRYWKLIAIPAVLAALVGGVAATRGDDVYRSTATVRVGDSSLPGSLVDARSGEDLDQLLATSIEIIQSDTVEDEVFADVPDEAADAFQEVDVDRISDTVLIEIEVLAEDPDSAQAIAQTWAEVYVAGEIGRATSALEQRSEEIDSQLVDLEAELEQVNGEIQAETEAIIDSIDADEDPILTGNETPTLTGLIRQRDEFLGQQTELRRQASDFDIEAALRGNGIEVAFPARPGSVVGSTSPTKTAIIAAFLGALLGFGLAVARDELDDRIHSEEELERILPEVPVLASVPLGPKRANSSLRLLDIDDARSEAYRALRINFEFSIAPSKARQGRAVMITSSVNGEGKSTTTINLAASLVSLGRSVAVVDADLRRGRLHERIGADRSPGLADMLIGDESLDAMQRIRVDDRQLFFLPGGRHHSPAELFSSDEFERMLRRLCRSVEYVLIDTPPVLPVSDALVIGRRVDDAIVVVGADNAREPDLRTAMESIAKLDIGVLGLVLNGGGRTTSAYESTWDEPGSKKRWQIPQWLVAEPGRNGTEPNNVRPEPIDEESDLSARARLRAGDGPFSGSPSDADDETEEPRAETSDTVDVEHDSTA